MSHFNAVLEAMRKCGGEGSILSDDRILGVLARAAVDAMTAPMNLRAEAPSHDVVKLVEWLRAAAAEEVSHTYAAKMREVSDALEASTREVAAKDAQVNALDQERDGFAQLANLYKRQRDEAMAALRERDEALKPFAVAADIRLCGGDHWTDEKRIQGTDIAFHITFGDLRRAARALATPTASDPAREGR